MFKFLQSPTIQTPISPTLSTSTPKHSAAYRYSSVDQCYSKPDSSLGSSRIQSSKVDKKYQTGQKTERETKMRAHSQKKLTLTSATTSNGCFTGSLGQSQNLSLMNAKDAYEGFKKNLQLKSANMTKNTQLQKKSKLTATCRTNSIKFPTSSTHIRTDSGQTIQQKENEYTLAFPYVGFQKQKTKVLIQTNGNNYYASNPEYYCRTEISQTVPNSPVYRNLSKGLNLQSKQIDSEQAKPNRSLQSKNYHEIVLFCQEKITQLKEQTNSVLMQNSKKIKELQSLLLQNQSLIERKDQTIRELQLKLLLKETTLSSNPLTKKSQFNIQNNDYLLSRITDLEKKVDILSQWSDEQHEKINSKIDQMNKFMDSFVTVKFHNLKFTLKTFVTKTEQKMDSVIDSVSRVEKIVRLNHLQSYEHILQKAKSFAQRIEKFTQIKHVEKPHFDDMRTTINTAVESFKHKPSYSTYQNMIESTEINESFWNNLEDFSVHETKMQQESSFTDDSFSYAPGGGSPKNFQISSNNSSYNEFALGSFPSFSKFSHELNICKESLHSIKSSVTEQDSICIRTIEEIAKYRQGPVTLYLDVNGYLRYKGSESYVFDRKGNILKPSKQEIEYCMEKRWILLA